MERISALGPGAGDCAGATGGALALSWTPMTQGMGWQVPEDHNTQKYTCHVYKIKKIQIIIKVQSNV